MYTLYRICNKATFNRIILFRYFFCN